VLRKSIPVVFGSGGRRKIGKSSSSAKEIVSKKSGKFSAQV